MSAENRRERLPPSHNSLSNVDQFLVACASVIDLAGTRRGEDSGFFDADWDDDENGKRFRLQRRMTSDAKKLSIS